MHALLQALTLWLQYLSMVGTTNVSVPSSISWLFSATHFAFSSTSSGVLSTDCLIDVDGAINPALKRVVVRLAVPWFTLVILMVAQILRSASGCGSRLLPCSALACFTPCLLYVLLQSTSGCGICSTTGFVVFWRCQEEVIDVSHVHQGKLEAASNFSLSTASWHSASAVMGVCLDTSECDS